MISLGLKALCSLQETHEKALSPKSMRVMNSAAPRQRVGSAGSVTLLPGAGGHLLGGHGSPHRGHLSPVTFLSSPLIVVSLHLGNVRLFLSLRVKRPSGMSSLLGKIGSKKQKMSTLEKSKLDWENFKEEEGIVEELAIHNRGKDG